MKKQRSQEFDPRAEHKRSLLIIDGGAAAAIVGAVVGFAFRSTAGMVAMLILLIVGLLVFCYGYLYARGNCRCLDCGEFLGEGYKIPDTLPNLCPHCGKPVK